MKLKNLVLILPIIFFLSCKEMIQISLKNEKLKETIYLKHISGIDYELNVISLSKSLSVDLSNDYQSQMDCFLYKLENDTLFIYGGWDESDFNVQKFKTRIKYVTSKDFNNEEYLYKNYKRLGYEVFPIEKEYIIQNRYK